MLKGSLIGEGVGWGGSLRKQTGMVYFLFYFFRATLIRNDIHVLKSGTRCQGKNIEKELIYITNEVFYFRKIPTIKLSNTFATCSVFLFVFLFFFFWCTAAVWREE